jgi:hypothetical protein
MARTDFTWPALSAWVIAPLALKRRMSEVGAVGFHPVTRGMADVELKSAK